VRCRALKGGCDEEILAWAHAHGASRSDEECAIWNRFITKLGWRDDRSAALREGVAKLRLSDTQPETICELIDIDEGRPLGATRSWEAQPLSFIIVMGVAGSGKSTVGSGLAEALGWEFLEADEFHSQANVAKMSAGTPLDDDDRAPWLAAVNAAVESRAAGGAKAVVACSALRESYRLVLAPDPAAVRFAYLRGDPGVIRDRLRARKGHFMGEDMLQSQFEALQEPVDALALDVHQAPDVLISRIRTVLGL
jgi:gluconokinase